jgi:lipopolysaccharide transport system ATP-binding protein
MDYKAINVNGLSKTYRVYRKPLDRLKGLLFKSAPAEFFTALKDITFSVNKGETLGIIGENGAGKSTLLKIITRVLTPSSGNIEVDGGVLSILELGTGFHPEFTGRENIFFYGDVLGFDRSFVKGRLDEIISFSELGLFIDKPVKTYSSGMFMRLAFSIVTAFKPEILILDEVLAVGDIHFQRKSLNRIMEFKKEGGTILFCSHDTYHIKMVCERALWLREGRMEMIGASDSVVSAYEHYQFAKEEASPDELAASAAHVMIETLDIENADRLETGVEMRVLFNTKVTAEALPYNIVLSLKLADGRGVYVTGTHMNKIGVLKGARKMVVKFRDIRLLPASYYVHVRVFDETGLILYHERVTPFFNIGKSCGDMGICLLDNEWIVK